MVIKKVPGVPWQEITSRSLYLRRREFLKSAATAAAAVGGLGALELLTDTRGAEAGVAAGAKLMVAKKTATTTDPQTPYDAVTTYNNFYEFGSDKSDPAKYSKSFKPKPWSVVDEGQCARPGTYTLEDILKPHTIEERIYRHRCVEGWSMVIPWDGFPLADLLKRFEPNGSAKFVEFTTAERPQEMPGLRQRFPRLLEWPYKEGLRIDEAMHPLTLMAVGVYGEELPNQNGAPLRLVLPWKYGFKSIKSIVKIRFADKQPLTSWQKEAPEYYQFYSNVNPGPTNSEYRDQATERRIGELRMRATMIFNGYADQVGSMYAGLDLRKNY